VCYRLQRVRRVGRSLPSHTLYYNHLKHRYAQENGETVTEDSPTGDSPRMIRLLDAERAALAAGGCVLRLAGLYNLERGAHNYWLSASEIVGGPDGIINLLHYEDAASACMAALLAGPQQQQRLFLISDGNPMTRRQICEYALSAAVYKEKSMPMFAPAQEGKLFTIGKVYDGSKSNQLLNWKPVYPSFAAFMASNA
jgi:nucleoside-diphosphate-sugar epimerase